MFGNGEASVYGGSLSFMAFLDDGRRLGIAIRPDEGHEGGFAEPNFLEHHGKPITAEIVKAYLPDLAQIAWKEKAQTLFGRANLSGTNGKYRITIATGTKGAGELDVPVAEIRAWLAAKVYGQ